MKSAHTKARPICKARKSLIAKHTHRDMYRARDIIAKATEDIYVSFITKDDERALVSYDPVEHIMVISTRPIGSVLGARINAFNFLKGDEATKCKQHIQELIG